MATAELAPSTGPRYAPEDPTLPEPWKGLIDGSTGASYYWNPETNITQYERPAALPPLLPPAPAPAPAPAAATPKLAPLPIARMNMIQTNGMIALQGHQMPQQLGQQPPQQQGLPMPQQNGQQMAQQQQGQHMQQQFPQQQSHQVTHSLEQQFSHQQLQQIPYPQGPQIFHSQHQQIPQQQVQQIPYYQGKVFGFPQREEIGFQQGNQTGFSSSQVQQTGFSSVHNLPAGTHHIQSPQTGFHSVPAQQTSSSSIDMLQTGGSLVQEQQKGIDSIHQKQIGGPMVQSQRGPSIQNQQAGGLPMGLKMDYEEVQQGRAGNDFYLGSKKEPRMVITQQPKLAAIPLAHNQQEMRMGAVHPQNVAPSYVPGLNVAAGRPMPNTYNYSSGTHAFSNNASMRPSPSKLSSPDVTNLSPAEVYCQQHEVTASGDNVPAPFMTFGDTGFPSEILREIQTAGFSSPTPIQAQTWPIALQSRDILAIAKTGSGKTLGYLIPAFIHLRRCQNNPQVGPTVLVLAPTRELATQIQDEAIKFGRSSLVSCTCLYGGAPKGPQLREIERGAHIVVATPGRLNDVLEMKKINFRQVSFLVLDEADRMLDMGFEPQIRKIVNEIPPRRQTLMYTATWPKEVRKIAEDLLINPVQVNIGTVNVLAANKAITQYVEVIPQMEKQRRLEQIIRSQERGSKVLIFCSTKRQCEELSRGIGRKFGAASIHGDKTQDQRDWVLNQFRSGKSPILVATDVAARGLDVKDIRVVINYDFPTGIEDYVHRIGRTGRAGATGISYTFFSDQDWKHAADLVKVLEGANQIVPPEVREIAAGGGPFKKARGGISRWDSGGGRRDSGGQGGRDGGRWDSGGRGGRDGGRLDFGGRGGRDGGRWDSGGRGGRDSGFGGGRGGRTDFSGGRGNRGRGFGGAGGPGGRGRHDRFDNLNGRGRYDIRRGIGGERRRGRSYSRSPDKVRTWDYDRSESRSRSRSRSWTHSRSCSRSRSRSRSDGRDEKTQGLEHVQNPPLRHDGAPVSQMLPISSGPNIGSSHKNESAGQLPGDQNPMPDDEAKAEPSQNPVVDL